MMRSGKRRSLRVRVKVRSWGVGLGPERERRVKGSGSVGCRWVLQTLVNAGRAPRPTSIIL